MRGLGQWIIGGLIGAFALAVLPLSGLLPHGTAGSDGVMRWYQDLATRQSVTLRALSVTPPDLTDPAMAARAAGHYEQVCAACHGSPAAPPDRLARDLWPAPPPLAQGHWRSARHQFQVVAHGLRRSAMPAWPAPDREDEVWDMVAFLRQMPHLSGDQYRAMAGTATCADCHGARGEGRDGIPRLDIQTPAYIADALRAYRAGNRQSGPMMAAAQRLDDTQIDRLAATFGRGVTLDPGGPGDMAALAASGSPLRDIPACLSCHGPQARGDYPRLIGQDPRYLRRQLELFQTLGTDRGGPHATVMAPIAQRLDDAEIRGLADWLAGLR